MHLRTACTLAASVLLLASCDDTATATPSGNTTDSVAQHDPTLVGSWVAPAGDFAVAHMVLRADGTGNTVGVSGTRRDVRSIGWSTKDTVLTLSDSTGLGSSKVFHIQGDSLHLLTYYFNGTIDTTTFVREAEPSLVPSAGERAAALVANWVGSARHITYTTDSKGDWVPSDTFWVPDDFRFQSEGTGMHLEYEEEYVCDTLPLSTSVTTDGFWDSLTTPENCDPDYDGACSYSAVRHCYEAWLPADTTRFTWWTSRSHVYLGMWMPGTTSPNIVGTQVLGWAVAGDSLKIQSFYDSGLVQGYKRTR